MMDASYGLIEYIDNFLSMSMMHMARGFNEHVKNIQIGLHKAYIFYLYDLYCVDLVYRNLIKLVSILNYYLCVLLFYIFKN